MPAACLHVPSWQRSLCLLLLLPHSGTSSRGHQHPTCVVEGSCSHDEEGLWWLVISLIHKAESWKMGSSGVWVRILDALHLSAYINLQDNPRKGGCAFLLGQM